TGRAAAIAARCSGSSKRPDARRSRGAHALARARPHRGRSGTEPLQFGPARGALRQPDRKVDDGCQARARRRARCGADGNGAHPTPTWDAVSTRPALLATLHMAATPVSAPASPRAAVPPMKLSGLEPVLIGA